MNHLRARWAALVSEAWGSTVIDEGAVERTEFWTNQRMGDEWVYCREQDLIAAGYPRGQRFDSLSDLKRYLSQVLPGMRVLIGPGTPAYMAGTKVTKDRKTALFLFGADMRWEMYALHEAAHALNRRDNGRSGAAHGKTWAEHYAKLLWENMGVAFPAIPT